MDSQINLAVRSQPAPGERGVKEDTPRQVVDDIWQRERDRVWALEFAGSPSRALDQEVVKRERDNDHNEEEYSAHDNLHVQLAAFF
jgi:hypothetical protein